MSNFDFIQRATAATLTPEQIAAQRAAFDALPPEQQAARRAQFEATRAAVIALRARLSTLRTQSAIAHARQSA
jgi:hypothetical protein